jgi:hypothetical protein
MALRHALMGGPLGMLLLAGAYAEPGRPSPAPMDHDRFTLPPTVQLAGSFCATFDGDTPVPFHYDSGGKRRDFTRQWGVASAFAPGTMVLRLTVDPDDAAGPWQGPNMATAIGHDRLYRFGTYSVRLRIPDVGTEPSTGMVAGFFTYLNDAHQDVLPPDVNRNGLHDNSEIDFEWLAADPTLVYLSAYTDAHHGHAPGEPVPVRKISRIVNLATGTILTTNYSEALGGASTELSGAEAQPATIPAIEDYDASKGFYTYGFTWSSDRIVWWILHPESGDRVILWDYRGPRHRIPQKPATIMCNLWHTSDWPVATRADSVGRPTRRHTLEIDWIRHDAAE